MVVGSWIPRTEHVEVRVQLLSAAVIVPLIKRCFPTMSRTYAKQKYHTWMQSAELRELTASEKLTLEQEYAMQRELLNLPTHVPLIKPLTQRDMR